MIAHAYSPQRRIFLAASGGLLLLAAGVRRAGAADEIEIELAGTVNGAHVWFKPRGLLIQPGQSVRWLNKDAGNVHTSTAYHPDNGKPLRIPAGASSWNSDYLMPGESFVYKFELPGVYDYFCQPHEGAGMVGRIIVGAAAGAAEPYAASDAQLPEAALQNLPAVAEIIEHKAVGA